MARRCIRGNAFAHDLIFEATLRSVPRAIATALQKDVATRLEASQAPAAHIAQHWLDADLWAQAAPYFVKAAEIARRAGRTTEQAALLQRAADCFAQAGDPASEFEALLPLVDANRSAARADEAHATALRMAGIATDPRQHALALQELGQCESHAMNFVGARDTWPRQRTLRYRPATGT